MNQIPIAVILAAGLGNRISSVNRNIPKPLLSLSGEAGGICFLEWHVLCLYFSGVKEIYLIGNHRTYQTPLNLPSEVEAQVKIHWILNPTEDLSTSGSAHSFWFALQSDHEILDQKRPVFLMDADIVYEPSVLKKVMAHKANRSLSLIAPFYEKNSEEVLVFSITRETAHTPFLHGKGLYQHLCEKQKFHCLGEATGVLLWHPADHALLATATDWCMKFSTAKTRSEHEDVTQRMMLFEKMESTFLPEGAFFMEVDTPEEYQVLKERVYPEKIKPLLEQKFYL